MDLLVAGVDIGSTTTKAVIISSGEVIGGRIISTETDPALAGKKVLDMALNDSHYLVSDLEYTIATGYGRVPYNLPTVERIKAEIPYIKKAKP